MGQLKGLKIREANLYDCKKCISLCQIDELKTAEDEYITERYLKSFIGNNNSIFIIAESENNILGCLVGEILSGGCSLLSLLTIDKNHRGKGVGKNLLEEYFSKCNEKGVNYIFGYATEFNKRTINFYKREGFNLGKKYLCVSRPI